MQRAPGGLRRLPGDGGSHPAEHLRSTASPCADTPRPASSTTSMIQLVGAGRRSPAPCPRLWRGRTTGFDWRRMHQNSMRVRIISVRSCSVGSAWLTGCSDSAATSTLRFGQQQPREERVSVIISTRSGGSSVPEMGECETGTAEHISEEDEWFERRCTSGHGFRASCSCLNFVSFLHIVPPTTKPTRE